MVNHDSNNLNEQIPLFLHHLFQFLKMKWSPRCSATCAVLGETVTRAKVKTEKKKVKALGAQWWQWLGVYEQNT
jgi:hypothetical protein